ncbi:HNH endonuclease [Duganella levis]|uniref:SAVED domain-containing protein n=1 Tax=Duganella levis TaxID=2692169 RepID=A0ABW9W673_9BURK|nr:HNH endonuclease [Duganella levis]MYN29203.1 SAVED domain-containing protein [Duganella levis]
MARTQARAAIPPATRHALWIAAAGRCQFRGCNKPVSRDFLTKRAAKIGELAHIVADSPAGARGVVGLSEKLADDANNLMLACYDCHARVDRNGKNSEYTSEQLLAMKREQEARIELIYSATGVMDSLPILMSFPVGTHLPVFDVRQINYAMLENSRFTRAPRSPHIHIDRADFDILDSAADFWPRAEAALQAIFEQRIRPALTEKNGPTHLTIAAFAPIPMLMKLGALLGDKMEASVLDLPSERWLWDVRSDCPAPKYHFDVPEKLTSEVAVLVSLSGRAARPNLEMPVLEFRAEEPNRGIIRSEAHVLEFRRQFNAFLNALNAAGVGVLHILPATPLSASVEIGRMLLPKIFEEVHAWEWQTPYWKKALRLK